MRNGMVGLMLTAILCVGVFAPVLTGCGANQGFIDGGFLGDGPDNTLHRMKLIAKNAAIVYDPAITDAEFETWVAEQRYEYRRFDALLELYRAFGVEHDEGVVQGYLDDVGNAESSLDAIEEARSAVVD